MENNNKNQSQQEQSRELESSSKKQQRRLKFKTLDGKITNLECDFDIKIIDLKKKLQEIYKIEPNRQRLLNKGKQFKDDETLDKLVEKDDTIIHLVFRSESDVKASQENASQNNQNNNIQNNTNVNSQNQNANPFQSIFSMICNSDEIRNLTSNVVNQIIGQNPNQNNNNQNINNNTTSTNPTINIGNTQYHSLNLTESLNLVNSPLHPASQSPNITNPPPLNLGNNIQIPNSQSQDSNNQNSSVPQLNPNNYAYQFPIASSERDKKYDIHLKKINEELNAVDEIMSNKIEPRIPLPLLNTTQNVFTAISRHIRKYVIVNQNMLCHLMRLADLMEREQFITNSETRMTGNKLLDQAYKALAHTSKASQDLSNVIKSSNFNTAPNMGYIGVVCQEIGLQSTSIPINVGDLNLNSPDLNLENLINSGNNNANNNNSISNLGDIVIRAINSNNNSNNNNIQQGQRNSPEITAAIPISVDVNIASSVDNNTNNNQNQNISSNNINNTIEVNKDQEKKESKKENKKTTNAPQTKDSEEQKEQKQPEKKDINPPSQNKNSQPNINNQNRTQNNQNTDFGNIFGNVMNQMMRPENLNSIAGAMGSLLGNNNNQNVNNNSGNSNPMGMFGNLIQNLMGSLGDDSDEEEINIPQSQNINDQSKQNKNIQTQVQDINIGNDNLFKKLVDSPQLRRETKLDNEEKIGVKIEPNIEFSSVSKEIISNLTVQDIFDMYNLRFKGLSRLRKDIKEKYFKENDEKILKKVVELLCERFILIENQIDKIKSDKEFNMEEFFSNHLKEIFELFISEEIINKSDEQWEEQMHKIIAKMFKDLIQELKEIYETGEDGAKTFIEFNIMNLIENLVGQKYLEKIQKYDEDIINKFVENVLIIIKTEKIMEESKKEDKEKPILLTIDEIFKIAMKDKERLEKEEKEEKEKGEEAQDKKKYSDFYYMTSLFKK